jgi:hypothetical protein
MVTTGSRAASEERGPIGHGSDSVPVVLRNGVDLLVDGCYARAEYGHPATLDDQYPRLKSQLVFSPVISAIAQCASDSLPYEWDVASKDRNGSVS